MKTSNADISKIFSRSLLCAMFLFACLVYYLALTRSAENPDLYYYMGSIRMLLEGRHPFVDFHIGYTPLSFYMMCLPVKMFGSTIAVAIACNTVMHLVNAFLVYMLLYQSVSNKSLCIFVSLHYMISNFFLDGMSFMLEPFVTFWGLLSLMAIKREKVIWTFVAGVLCFCAFWSKQYGLGYMFLCGLYIICNSGSLKNFFKHTIPFVIAFFLTGAFFIWLIIRQNVEISAMFNLSGSEYEKNGFLGLLAGYGTIIGIAPSICLAVYLFVRHTKIYKCDKMLPIYLCGILGFMLSTYVRIYMHYLQLASPFVLMSVAIIFYNYTLKTLDYRYLKCFVYSLVVPVIMSGVMATQLIIRNERADVYQVSEKISKYIPKNSSKVYITSRLLCIGINNYYEPPMLKKYGFSNGFAEKGDAQREIINDASCFIFNTNKLCEMKIEEPLLYKYVTTNFHKRNIPCRDKRFSCILFTRN